MLLALVGLVFLGMAISVIPVVGQALALKRRISTLEDNQLFVALSGAQTDLESLKRSFGALSSHVGALRVALDRITDSINSIRRLGLTKEIGQLKAQFRSLLSVLR
ncbi:MAG: hypothetical protein NVSMB31_11980 [Vulcanimicrobiaceae bacterium]